jgi:hypothetical protein
LLLKTDQTVVAAAGEESGCTQQGDQRKKAEDFHSAALYRPPARVKRAQSYDSPQRERRSFRRAHQLRVGAALGVPFCARNNHPKANPRHLIAKRSRPSGPHQPSLQFLNSDATPLPPEKKQSPSSLSLKPIHGLSAESPCMNRSPCPLVNYTNHQKLFDYSLPPIRTIAAATVRTPSTEVKGSAGQADPTASKYC